jgi:hypothetical protein
MLFFETSVPPEDSTLGRLYRVRDADSGPSGGPSVGAQPVAALLPSVSVESGRLVGLSSQLPW